MKNIAFTMLVCCLYMLNIQAQVLFLKNGQAVWLHQLESSESMLQIADFYGLSMPTIEAFNATSSAELDSNAHQLPVLKVPMPISSNTQAARDYGGKYLAHKVKGNERLHTIADKYASSIAEISTINRLKSHRLKANTYLLVPNKLRGTKKYTAKRIRMTGFLSVGFLMGNTYSWEGNTTFSYTINGRYTLKYDYTYDKFRFANELFSNLGFRHDIGRYFLKNIDRFELRSKIEYLQWRWITPLIMGRFQTQLFKSHLVDFDGNRFLTGSFMAPGYTHYIAGAAFQHSAYNIQLGLYDIKTTYVLNETLFEDKPSVYGVLAGKKSYVEHGMSLRATVSYDEGGKFRWQADAYCFARPDAIDVEFRSDASFNITRRISISLVTELFYDKDYSEKVQFHNEMVTAFTFYK